MIDYLQGPVHKIHDHAITMLVGGIGLRIHVPKPTMLTPTKNTTLYTYLHWNTEQGPTLYGFTQELEREVFLIIIDCPKIGPKIALSILGQMEASQFLEAISTQNIDSLSTVNGIGEKKAEQMIANLKHKVAKRISSGAFAAQESNQRMVDWHTLNQALVSLGYSKQEVQHTLMHLGKTIAKNMPFDQLLRQALAFLTKKI